MDSLGSTQRHVASASIWQQRVEALLHAADVRVDGDRAWDIRVHEPAFHRRVLLQGSLGLGESYMDGWWDCPALDQLVGRLLRAGTDRCVRGLTERWDALRGRLFNLQTRRRARIVGERHYDLGNDLYHLMLGRRMVYSCGYWKDADDLDAAQEHKLDLICRKLRLAPGMRVLDIGCGWGEALKFAAERYGVHGTGVTISREQADYARALCRGLPIEIRLQDYREVGDRYDRVWSIGMFEHVGRRNYRAYFDAVHRCLAPDGLTLLHTIGGNASRRHTDPWIDRYIFPNSLLPSAAQIAEACEERFVLEDWHGFGPDYARTLQAWRDNFERGRDRLPPRYDERFARMWRFYLGSAIALFRERHAQLWQIVLSPQGVRGGLAEVR